MIQALPDGLRREYEGLRADSIVFYPNKLVAEDGRDYDRLVARYAAEGLPWEEELDLDGLEQVRRTRIDAEYVSLRYPICEYAAKVGEFRAAARQAGGKGSGLDLAWKVHANSMYGVLASPHLPTSNFLAANQVTSWKAIPRPHPTTSAAWSVPAIDRATGLLTGEGGTTGKWPSPRPDSAGSPVPPFSPSSRWCSGAPARPDRRRPRGGGPASATWPSSEAVEPWPWAVGRCFGTPITVRGPRVGTRLPPAEQGRGLLSAPGGRTQIVYDLVRPLPHPRRLCSGQHMVTNPTMMRRSSRAPRPPERHPSCPGRFGPAAATAARGGLRCLLHRGACPACPTAPIALAPLEI
jgi:hypothetical protein